MSVHLLAVYRDDSLHAATYAGVMYCSILVSKVNLFCHSARTVVIMQTQHENDGPRSNMRPLFRARHDRMT